MTQLITIPSELLVKVVEYYQDCEEELRQDENFKGPSYEELEKMGSMPKEYTQLKTILEQSGVQID